ncbi:MAG: hypothetical protein ACKVT1_06770 [Dehalococcoidia bacterium]
MSIRPGDPAPPFAGPCSDGVERSLARYRGRNLILVFHRHLG